MTRETIKLLSQVLVCLVFMACAAGCGQAGIARTNPKPPAQAEPQASPGIEITRPASATMLSDLIAGIRSKPGDYLGRQVEIVGYYRGWNLLQEVQAGPPVTRSDWVIADRSGAIYVTGLMPEGLNPASKEDTSTVVRLAATVEQNENGVYLRGTSAETISGP